MTEQEAMDWLLAQCEGVGTHYRQPGDERSACGDRWSAHTAATDFVTCKQCVVAMREVRHAVPDYGSIERPLQYTGAIGRDPETDRRLREVNLAARAGAGAPRWSALQTLRQAAPELAKRGCGVWSGMPRESIYRHEDQRSVRWFPRG